MNLWTTHTGVRDFVLSAKLGRIAAQLMEVGVSCSSGKAVACFNKGVQLDDELAVGISPQRCLWEQVEGVRCYHDQGKMSTIICQWLCSRLKLMSLNIHIYHFSNFSMP